MDNTRYIIVQHASDEDVGDSGLCYVMPKLYDTVDAAKAAANKALETDAEECPKGDVVVITDSDIKEYFSDTSELKYYAGEKDVYGGRHYHNVYAVFKVVM